MAGWALKNRAAGWALILTTLLGSADELHQRYVPQRTSTITDVGFDLCGGYFALMILFAALRFWEHKVERAIAQQDTPWSKPQASFFLFVVVGVAVAGKNEAPASAICHSCYYVAARKAAKSSQWRICFRANPQVIHTVDKKVTYAGVYPRRPRVGKSIRA